MTAFLESGPVRKPAPQHEEQTGDSHWEQVQSSLQCQKVNSDLLHVQQLLPPLGEAHPDREKPHEASTQHVTAHRSLEERHQQQQQTSSQQPRVESKLEDIFVTETLQNNFKFDCTVEPSGVDTFPFVTLEAIFRCSSIQLQRDAASYVDPCFLSLYLFS